jgi:hypothetical protein
MWWKSFSEEKANTIIPRVPDMSIGNQAFSEIKRLLKCFFLPVSIEIDVNARPLIVDAGDAVRIRGVVHFTQIVAFGAVHALPVVKRKSNGQSRGPHGQFHQPKRTRNAIDQGINFSTLQ